MELLSSWDLIKKGKTAKKSKYRHTLFQPMQMCSITEKDENWLEANVDWFEYIGMCQLDKKYSKTIKNYELAAGIIDKADYYKEERKELNDHNDIDFGFLDLADDDEIPEALNLTFYPIIPNVIKVLTGEFSKRYQEVKVQAVDQFSKNEKLEEKHQEIIQYAEASAKMKLYTNLLSSGYQPSSEEEVQQMQEEIAEQVKNLPEIKALQNSNYRSTFEKWAQHQIRQDDQRFNMYEKENMAFADYLKQDCQFWHIDLLEDDYNVELWSPINTFFHLSPDKKYISEANFAGRIQMMSVPDIIDKYKERLHKHDLDSLEQIYYSSSKIVPYGYSDDHFYDETKSYKDQYPNDLNIAKRLNNEYMGGHTYNGMLNTQRTFESYINEDNSYNYPAARVTELYWKSQKKMGFLFKIDEFGESQSTIITEDYLITQKPIYDETFKKGKSKETLIYGEHIDWFWINEVYKGCKIDTGPLASRSLNQSSDFKRGNMGSIYFDMGPLKFQFKGEFDLWDAKIPIEGIAKSDIRLPQGVSLVDLMKPYQVKYNIVNNQIKDILLDERGTVVLLDQNTIPTNSMGEDWGKNNLAKIGYAMDEFGVLPVDTSLQNMGERGAFSHFQTLNLEQSNRFTSRINIAQWCKQEAFMTVGITPERLGSVAASQSATGTQQAVNNSYSQTEMYFVEHINFLMPKVRNMMINAAQYYNSTKKSIRLSYMTDKDEEIFFETEGYKLLARDFQVYTNFKPNSRGILEQMKSLMINNNTTNANVLDIFKVLNSSTPSEVIEAAKESIDNFQKQQEEQRAHEQQMLEKQLQSQQAETEASREFEREENTKDREVDIFEAQIKAMGFLNDGDINKDEIPDVAQLEKFNLDYSRFQENMVLQREKLNLDKNKAQDQTRLKQEELQTRRDISNKQLDIARENTSKSEIEAKRKEKNQNKSKK